MDPNNDYLKNYPQPLHLHPNSMLRFNNDSQNNSFRHNSPRSRDRPYFNRGGHNRRRHQNSDSQYSSDGSNFNDSSSPNSMNSPYWRQSQSNRGRHSRPNSNNNSQVDISAYFHPSMLEDPWAGLNSITESRQANIQSGKVATYDYSSSDEEKTPGNTQDNVSDDDDEEEDEDEE